MNVDDPLNKEVEHGGVDGAGTDLMEVLERAVVAGLERFQMIRYRRPMGGVRKQARRCRSGFLR